MSQIFDATYCGYSTDELFFVSLCHFCGKPVLTLRLQYTHDWDGRPWYNEAKAVFKEQQFLWLVDVPCSHRIFYRYNPVEFVHKWSTPQLIIHGGKDYRIPETESIGAFHALQQYVYSLLSHVLHSDINCFPDSGFPLV